MLVVTDIGFCQGGGSLTSLCNFNNSLEMALFYTKSESPLGIVFFTVRPHKTGILGNNTGSFYHREFFLFMRNGSF